MLLNKLKLEFFLVNLFSFEALRLLQDLSETNLMDIHPQLLKCETILGKGMKMGINTC